MYTGFLGIIALLMIAYSLSNNRKGIKFQTIFWGLGLQAFLGLIILKVPIVKSQFFFVDKIFKTLISFSDKGSDFLFSSFVPGVGYHEAMINFAFRALPVVIFFFKSHFNCIPFWDYTNFSKMDIFFDGKKHEN